MRKSQHFRDSPGTVRAQKRWTVVVRVACATDASRREDRSPGMQTVHGAQRMSMITQVVNKARWTATVLSTKSGRRRRRFLPGGSLQMKTERSANWVTTVIMDESGKEKQRERLKEALMRSTPKDVADAERVDVADDSNKAPMTDTANPD